MGMCVLEDALYIEDLTVLDVLNGCCMTFRQVVVDFTSRMLLMGAVELLRYLPLLKT
jgi:hypothetical protein